MDNAFAVGDAAENVLIYDGQNHRRTKRAVELVRGLKEKGYTVYAFAGQNFESYRAVLPALLVRPYMPIDKKDVREITDAKNLHGKVAVVLHGLLSPGGKHVNQLLADERISVVAISCVPAVRGDHRYTRVWTSGSEWRRRGEAKGFVEVVSPSVASPPVVSPPVVSSPAVSSPAVSSPAVSSPAVSGLDAPSAASRTWMQWLGVSA